MAIVDQLGFPAVAVVLPSQAPELRAQVDYAPLWPPFLFAAPSMRLYAPLAERWPYAQLLLTDRTSGGLLGWLDTAPSYWDGADARLPGGWDDLMRRAVDGLSAGRTPTALAMMSLNLLPDARGRGLGATAIELSRALAGRLGLRAVLAPVRPTLKSAHPHVPMEEYVARLRADGLPEDPWLRAHLRAGGRVAGIAEESTVIEAPLADWEAWGAELPADRAGTFTLDGALVPVRISPDGRTARYTEPNVWVVHPPARIPAQRTREGRLAR
ncbi:hypothetical protein GCM10009801_59380 [Streptomyces albiaxialis]|uniref:Acetyltransferase-like protein n=1 Tax=Streptomyces albiaxialis TaxID=329523 RepID=A0ABP5I404_9ACTN